MLLLILIFLFILMLTKSDQALPYAAEGLLLWFNHMLPALFPCIVWSNIMTMTNGSSIVSKWIYPFLHQILGLSKQGSFVFLIGFTGGFPLGAKLSADLLKKGQLTLSESTFLLSFCNNIGPVYMIGFLFPLLHISRKVLCLFILFGIPILYGVFQYHFVYHGIPFDTPDNRLSPNQSQKAPFSSALDTSLHNGVNSIVMLGAYMIFFQTFRLFYLFLPIRLRNIATLFTEINSGVNHFSSTWVTPNSLVWIFCSVTLGGLCCIAQTDHMLQGTELATSKYVFHKVIQSALVFSAFYVCQNVLHISL